ncbi:Leukemia inhibitory factor receptor, partial [Nibea albiflora]
GPNVMATLKTRWIQSILLVNLSSWCTLAVASLAPAPPPPPECFVPYDELLRVVHINCTWDLRPEPQIPANYSLHWEPANSEPGYVITGTRMKGSIPRKDFSHHDEIRVWVQAKNQHGSAKSKVVVFNTANITPVGELDVWMDCEKSHETFNCTLMWKRLPMHRACGFIRGYEVRLYYNNNTVKLVNVSTAEPEGRLACNETQCRFTSSLTDVSSISVSAYNAHGATEPSKLVVPVSGKDKNEQAIGLKMSEENLTVSWDLPSQLSDSLKEYVVQYKQAGCSPDQTFDWMKVNKSQKTAFFKGQFKKNTPYRVSLFTVSNSGEVHHLSSLTGYSLQKSKCHCFMISMLSPRRNLNLISISLSAPSKVPLFQVSSVAATHVTLLWKDVPVCERYGVILYYQIGVVGQKEKSCAWGDKVPDPRNSHIFKDMKHQINDPKSWICVPTFNEPHPEISLLEVVEIPFKASKSSLEKTSDADKLTRPLVRKGDSQMDCQDDQRDNVVIEENHRTDHKYGRQAYSKMVDSDEDKEDGWSSEEEQCKSGYEKHFMPTPLEILEVS